MSKTVLQFIAKFILLVLAQAIIFNNIVLYNVAVAFVFIYIIISMPLTWTTNLSLTVGFFAGLSVDIFSDTAGVNSLACTTLAFVRKPVLHMYVQHDEDLGGMKPSHRSMGTADFLKYLLSMSLIYCTMAYCIEAFTFFNPVRLALRIVASTAFTMVVIYAIDTISTRSNEKRL